MHVADENDENRSVTLNARVTTSGVQSRRYLYFSSSDLQLRRHARSKSPGVEGGSVGVDFKREELHHMSMRCTDEAAGWRVMRSRTAWIGEWGASMHAQQLPAMRTRQARILDSRHLSTVKVSA